MCFLANIVEKLACLSQCLRPGEASFPINRPPNGTTAAQVQFPRTTMYERHQFRCDIAREYLKHIIPSQEKKGKLANLATL